MYMFVCCPNKIKSLCSDGQSGLNISILSKRQNNTRISESVPFEVNRDQVLFVASLLYFLVQECPIFIPLSRFKILRSEISIFLTDGALPMQIDRI